ncbi:processed acidic surface protein [Terribacillus aidingensis]|uniref:Processed acidic surface protein n=1 Tax=Terribacillus aidingensis TaxID=586416 RepID=A0A285P5H4_9BACI|nr:processed acidic surface protein [Terribacillus aidingensis]SNZ16970.1 processed acidic surface protein [Terribacillus aidingensis]
MTKKLLVGIIMVLLCLQAVAPQTAFAAINKKELEAYAAELGTDAESLNRYLIDFEWGGMEEYGASSVNELREWLGEPVTEENLQSFLDESGYTKEDIMKALTEKGLADKGYTAADILLYSDLNWLLGDPATSENLQELAEELGLTEKELADLFAANGLDLYSYMSMDNLYELIYNEVNDLSLHFLLQETELTQEEFNQLLAENKKTLDDFQSYEELAEFVYEATGYGEISMDDYWEMAGPFLDLIGISKEEFFRAFTYMEEVVLHDPEAFITGLEDIAARAEALGNFETSTELTEAQGQELIAIWDDLMGIFQMKAAFYLVDGDTKTPVTMEELMKVTDLENRVLLVDLFDAQGNHLLNFTITGELFGSELVAKAPVLEAPESEAPAEPAYKHEAPVKEKAVTAPVKIAAETVKQEGKRLPDTASPIGNLLAAGTALLAAGAALYVWNRRKKHSN